MVLLPNTRITSFANICSHNYDFGLDEEWNFFASAHVKNACGGTGGTTKSEITEGSLQIPLGEQILIIVNMYLFWTENLEAIKFILVKKKEDSINYELRRSCLDCCQRIIGTRIFHGFLAISEGIIRSYVVSNSDTFEDHSIKCHK